MIIGNIGRKIERKIRGRRRVFNARIFNCAGEYVNSLFCLKLFRFNFMFSWMNK